MLVEKSDMLLLCPFIAGLGTLVVDKIRLSSNKFKIEPNPC